MSYEHRQDVVYGYKDGMGLVMDVFTPPTGNGAAVIWILSAGMRSSLGFDSATRGPVPEQLARRFQESRQSLLDGGYVVVALAHSSTPKYRADEITPDISRSIRYIRYHADHLGIDPQRVGITGTTAGGGLALTAATAPVAAEPESADPVDRVSSSVQAVVALSPFTYD